VPASETNMPTAPAIKTAIMIELLEVHERLARR